MDYIKSWIEYFRRSTINGENQPDVLKNEFSKLSDNKPTTVDINTGRNSMGIDSDNDIMRIFFGDPERHSNQSDFSSDMGGSWLFGYDMFRSANEIHKEFLNLINELNNGFSSMESFIFQDSPMQNSEDCTGCDGPLVGESLRDYYLRVPDLESIKSDNKCSKLGIINPGRDSGAISSDGQSYLMPLFHQSQQIVSVSVGPDGVLEITKITKDSNGKSEKTVTKLDLRDRM